MIKKNFNKGKDIIAHVSGASFAKLLGEGSLKISTMMVLTIVEMLPPVLGK